MQCRLYKIMNSNVTRSLPTIQNALNFESRKKSGRKRHRNKSRNYNSKKKRLKKSQGRKNAAASKLSTSKFDFKPATSQIMSNWYWSNYRKAVQWQEKHRVAYWKACALALCEENRHLLQIINQMRPGMHPEASVTHNLLLNNSERKHTNRNQHSDSSNICNYVNSDDDSDNDNSRNANDANVETNDDIEFELSEEMMEFFEQSYKHKMEQKKLKEKELLQKSEDEIRLMQTNKIKRSTEMNLLYGEGASMIIGMETAVQLSFEKYCDTKSPKYWPNIPFRL